MQRDLKLQPAIDFLVSYGIVIMIVGVALAAIASIALQQPSTPSCISPPGFSCSFLAINKSGVLTAKISQNLGTQIIMNGAACAAQQNNTGDYPMYDNVMVGSNIVYYPANYAISGHYPPGNSIYSGGYYTFYVYCYGPGGRVALAPVGSQFTGYLWLNYTITGYGKQTQKVASFTAEYS